MTNKESLNEQLYKLTIAYYNKHSLNKENITSEEFLSVVFDYFLTRDLFGRFDPERAALSTYVYNAIDNNLITFITSAKYGLSINASRSLYDKRYDICKRHNIIFPASIAKTEHSDDDPSEGTEKEVFCISDNSIDVEKTYESEQILKIALEILDSSRFSDKNKTMLKEYILAEGKYTQADIATKYNVSRQSFNDALMRFRRLLAKNRKFKDFLPEGY
nr:hypothetical protein DGKKSRWO_DGKKSRWO_CDS_0168 [uncultured phage]CAI9752347.1 hypothetical protein CVNMHQAP_CVNMHQAP_CDS_0170 [uncultured phage]